MGNAITNLKADPAYSKTESDAMYAKVTNLTDYAKTSALMSLTKANADQDVRMSGIDTTVFGLDTKTIGLSTKINSLETKAEDVFKKFDTRMTDASKGLDARIDSLDTKTTAALNDRPVRSEIPTTLNTLVCKDAVCTLPTTQNSIRLNAIGGFDNGPFMVQFYDTKDKVCLDGGKKDGIPYGIACDATNANQHFYWNSMGRLVNANTGKCLDNMGGAANAGYNWGFNNCSDHTNQQMLRTSNGGLGFPDADCLDIGSASGHAGCQAKNANQRFRFKQIKYGADV